MKARIDGFRVIAFNPAPEPRIVQLARAAAQKAIERPESQQFIDAINVSIEGYFKLVGAPLILTNSRRPPSKLRNIGKPVVDLTGDDREGA